MKKEVVVYRQSLAIMSLPKKVVKMSNQTACEQKILLTCGIINLATLL
jgi:hypothetical protein